MWESVDNVKSKSMYTDVLVRNFDYELEKWLNIFTKEEAVVISFSFVQHFIKNNEWLNVNNYENVPPFSDFPTVSALFDELNLAQNIQQLTGDMVRKFDNLNQRQKVSLRPALVYLCALFSVVMEGDTKTYKFNML